MGLIFSANSGKNLNKPTNKLLNFFCILSASHFINNPTLFWIFFDPMMDEHEA